MHCSWLFLFCAWRFYLCLLISSWREFLPEECYFFRAKQTDFIASFSDNCDCFAICNDESNAAEKYDANVFPARFPYEDWNGDYAVQKTKAQEASYRFKQFAFKRV